MGDHDSLDEAPHLLVTARGEGEREALHLHQERTVPGFAAALASSGELEVRLLELGDLSDGRVDLIAPLALAQGDGDFPVLLLGLRGPGRVLPLQGVGGADARAKLAARAVLEAGGRRAQLPL